MGVRTDACPAGCHDVLRLTPVEVTHQVVGAVSGTEIASVRTLYKHQQTNVNSVINILFYDYCGTLKFLHKVTTFCTLVHR